MNSTTGGPARSGHAAIDRFLDDGYERVRGMSSQFAAAICGHVVRRQTEIGVRGDFVEIGTFEGRFFIALGLALQPGEHAYGFDLFDWPGSTVRQNLLANAGKHGLARDRFTACSYDTGKLTHSADHNPPGSATQQFEVGPTPRGNARDLRTI